MKKGEIWQARLPASAGHVQMGTRPVLIVQNDSFIASLPTVVVVPFTASLAAARFSPSLMVQHERPDKTSLALVFQVRVLDQRSLVTRLGVLDSKTLGQVIALVEQLIK